MNFGVWAAGVWDEAIWAAGVWEAEDTPGSNTATGNSRASVGMSISL
jgi:hypothetical protein